uniref:Uncharacterized protein n=1 Tax=Arundo donax TaxID=35708 RepID=A0A0A9FXF3_ARUDO
MLSWTQLLSLFMHGLRHRQRVRAVELALGGRGPPGMALGRHDHLLLHPGLVVHHRVLVLLVALEHRVQVRVRQVRLQIEVWLPRTFQCVLPHRLL